jgi:drug/metabolite transporter (DMT)-like permease
VLVAAALTGFAANSLLTRAGLGAGLIDPASFTGLRLASGALMLLGLARLRGPGRGHAGGGSWASATMLGGYAVAFTLAYSRIGAGIGALILFGAVHVTMVGTGLVRGERPGLLNWLGLALAVTGLVVLTRPGLSAPDPLGSLLMAIAGACWGVYSLAGRRSRDPLGATAGNFIRATVFGVAFAAISWPSRHVTSTGALLAVASGALASGVGYTFWYSALPRLAAWRAAVLQLLVPIVTAISAVVLLSEPMTSRLVVAMVCVLAGVGLTIRPARGARAISSSASPDEPGPARLAPDDAGHGPSGFGAPR